MELLAMIGLLAWLPPRLGAADLAATPNIRLNPVKFLQAVESARLEIPPSRLKVRVRYQDPDLTTDQNLEVVFDGDLRRFDQLDEHAPVRAFFDGSLVTYFDGIDSVTLRKASDATSDYLFDPRLLGIMAMYRWDDALDSALPYRDGKKIESVGRENIADKATWHVRMIDKHDQHKDIWIGDEARVYRYDFSIKGLKHIVVQSFYEDAKYPWLPSRVETRCYQTNGAVKYTRQIALLKAEANVELPEGTWTLATLNLPINATVSDLRIKQRIGYWDGLQIKPSPSFQPALKANGN